MKSELERLKIKNYLQARVVDDITLLPNVIEPGMRFIGGEVKFCEEKVDEDSSTENDVRTLSVIQEIANNIDKNISVTFDVPSLNSDGMVPVLDVKMKVKENKLSAL